MIKSILISRTDRIGDVVLTLPMAGYLKKHMPLLKIGFLCTDYTKPIVERSEHVDEIINWSDLQLLDIMNQVKKIEEYDSIVHVFPDKKIARLAKNAKVPWRIGTSHCVYNWLTCNKLVNLKRNKSFYHESQLNLILLRQFGLKEIPDLKEIATYYGIRHSVDNFHSSYTDEKISIALHPKSGGSSREWSIENYDALIKLLDSSRYRIFITGSESEHSNLAPLIRNNSSVIDMVGKLTLVKFVDFLSSIDVFVAASTGPLHISAALGKIAIGLFPPKRPLFPLRWGPIGMRASYLTSGKEACTNCRKTNICECLNSISPIKVKKEIESQLMLCCESRK